MRCFTKERYFSAKKCTSTFAFSVCEGSPLKLNWDHSQHPSQSCLRFYSSNKARPSFYHSSHLSSSAERYFFTSGENSFLFTAETQKMTSLWMLMWRWGLFCGRLPKMPRFSFVSGMLLYQEVGSGKRVSLKPSPHYLCEELKYRDTVASGNLVPFLLWLWVPIGYSHFQK